MSFTNQQPFFLTEESFKEFSKGREPFHCKLCGRDFKPGDWIRWVYANSTPGLTCGNFFVCKVCGEGQETKTLLACAKISFDEAVKLAKRWDLI